VDGSSSSSRSVSTQALRRNGSSIGQINGFGSSSSPGSAAGSSSSSASSSSGSAVSGSSSSGRGRLQAGQAVAELQATQVGTGLGKRYVLLQHRMLCCAVMSSAVSVLPCCRLAHQPHSNCSTLPIMSSFVR
jgi:hypothetical protein